MATPGTEDLGQAVDVEGVEVEALFDFLAHASSPGFRPENPDPELQCLAKSTPISSPTSAR